METTRRGFFGLLAAGAALGVGAVATGAEGVRPGYRNVTGDIPLNLGADVALVGCPTFVRLPVIGGPLRVGDLVTMDEHGRVRGSRPGDQGLVIGAVASCGATHAIVRTR